MPSDLVKVLWILFWSLVAAGWNIISFQWLKKSIEKIGPQTNERKAGLRMIITRRIIVFISIGLLLYLALKTEPLAAIAMVVVITVTTWVQVIVYNHRLNRDASQKEKEFGSN